MGLLPGEGDEVTTASVVEATGLRLQRHDHPFTLDFFNAMVWRSALHSVEGSDAESAGSRFGLSAKLSAKALGSGRSSADPTGRKKALSY
jgi:hypothetical protein